MVGSESRALNERFFVCMFLTSLFGGSNEGTKTPEFDLETAFASPRRTRRHRHGWRRWKEVGHHQFVSISHYPDGRYAPLSWRAMSGQSIWHGRTNIYFRRQRPEWRPFAADAPAGERISCPILNGHSYACRHPSRSIWKRRIDFAGTQGKLYATRGSFLPPHRMSPPVQNFFVNMDAARWIPSTKQCSNDVVQYDSAKALIWTLAEGEESSLVPELLSNARRYNLQWAPLRRLSYQLLQCWWLYSASMGRFLYGFQW